jgi:hypothetical protein
MNSRKGKGSGSRMALKNIARLDPVAMMKAQADPAGEGFDGLGGADEINVLDLVDAMQTALAERSESRAARSRRPSKVSRGNTTKH